MNAATFGSVFFVDIFANPSPSLWTAHTVSPLGSPIRIKHYYSRNNKVLSHISCLGASEDLQFLMVKDDTVKWVFSVETKIILMGDSLFLALQKIFSALQFLMVKDDTVKWVFSVETKIILMGDSPTEQGPPAGSS